ncbi:MAG: Hsp33 family molecular chaperone HslO [Proteobacteria bacterium]|nr:Hsp33 family molecular chaperone HslO [Pseudomonadota bacterium]
MPYSQATDLSVPFLLPHLSLRGRLVRLQNVSTTIIGQHDYPYAVAKILAELLATGATLAGLLKYEGIFTLQTKSDGPIKLAVLDVTNQGHMRGYTQLKSNEIKQNISFAELFGQGYLAFTVDQVTKGDRYQGIVTLNHESLASSIEHYFDQSEQLESRICIFSERTHEDIWKSGVLLLQEMPSKRVDEEAWSHAEALLNTLSSQEFLDFSIPYKTLLTNLFHEAGVTIFEPLHLKAQCRCSKERIRVFLDTLSPTEIESLLENGQLKMTCEFCNHHYTFDRKDLMTVH